MVVNNFRIFIEKVMVNYYWILCVFQIVSAFVMKYGFRIVKVFRIFIEKRMINDYWLESEFGTEYIYRVVQHYSMES